MISKFRLFERENEDVVGEIILNSINDPQNMNLIFAEKANEYNWGEDQSIENCFDILHSTALDYTFLIEPLPMFIFGDSPNMFKNKLKAAYDTSKQGIYINFNQDNTIDGRTFDIINTEPDAAN